MAHSLQKAIGVCTLLMACATTTVYAQVIYRGGNNDGFTKATYSEPDPSSDIYSGGVNDGFAVSSYSESNPSTNIYRGGVNDGFAKAFYSEPDPAGDIYRGGINDGFAFSAYSEPDLSSDIYAGGNNDGFAKFFLSEELALPVEWKYFTITKNNGRPLLQWGADKEGGCLSYEVLRSHDAKNFQSISALDCQGKAVNNEYEFEDLSPLWHRVLYYKIAQYDIDGEFIYSAVKAFNSNEPSKPEVFYKNGQLIVKTDRESKLRAVYVLDFTGRTLCSQFADEQAGYYTIDCQLASNRLMIIQLTFDSIIHSTYMRISE